MIICGLKLTHDAAVCILNNGKLEFCIDMEKLDNNLRYGEISDAGVIVKILKNEGLNMNDIDLFAVDGWGGYDQDKLALQPRLTIGKDHNFLSIDDQGKNYLLPVAEYEEKNLASSVVLPKNFDQLKIRGRKYKYESYLHAAGHIMSAYATSPFSKNNESSYVLVWDGGMYPRLYYFDAEKLSIENLGPISFLVGNVYTIFSQHFGPFKVGGNFAKDDLSIAGKVMAYIAKGEVKEELLNIFNEIYYGKYDKPMGFANILANSVKQRIKSGKYKDEDILRSFHQYLESHLTEKIKKKFSRHDFGCSNLCYSGGCALNIKWNSAIRNADIFRNIYVPPFPNDSGSAIGAACAAMFNHEKKVSLEWDVFSGPRLIKRNMIKGWSKEKCSPKELARLLFKINEPVMVLAGRAELGPRALGHRSILASPADKSMKDKLNKIKKRELYRPISPVCLEERARDIFSPGIRDPFMLFDHNIKKNWKAKIPAVVHIDGSARLQTVDKSNKLLYELLSEFEKVSGLPVLCNTSANDHGHGFFPDLASASHWAEKNNLNILWSEGSIYRMKTG